MFDPISHIVRTVCFEIEAPDHESVNDFCEAANRLNHEHILDKLLCRYVNSGMPIYIDRLELDLGNLDNCDSNVLETAFTEKLEEWLASETFLSLTGKEFNHSEHIHSAEAPSPAQQDSSILLFFLETGTMPWYYDGQDTLETIFHRAMKIEASVTLSKLTPALSDKKARQRLLSHLSEEAILSFLRSSVGPMLYAASLQFLETFEVTMEWIIGQVSGRKSWLHTFLESVSVGRSSSKDYATALANTVTDKFMPQQIITYEKWITTIRGNIFHAPDDSTRHLWQSLLDVSLLAFNPIELIQVQHVVPAAKQPEINQKEFNRDKVVTDRETDGYFIENAGLVLLNAAGLKQCMTGLGWLVDNQIPDASSKEKIIAWLHYLSHGTEKIQEYNLPLIKVLVGLHPEDPVSFQTELTESEINQADDWLWQVILRWSKLGNVSREGLRATFIRRKGRLSRAENAWHLHTEPKGVDILIDKLPWSFSIIKFPWMEIPLFTQWQTKI